MASEERNALAELAERLDNGRWNLDVNDYNKAQRIISELAKVPDCTFKGNPRLDKSADAVIACRAIAEEGANYER